MTEEQKAYNNILLFCKGYESTDREMGKHYKALKKVIEKMKEEAGQ